MSLRPATEEAAAGADELDPVVQPDTVPAGAATFWAMRWEKGAMTWVKTSLVVSAQEKTVSEEAASSIITISMVSAEIHACSGFTVKRARARPLA